MGHGASRKATLALRRTPLSKAGAIISGSNRPANRRSGATDQPPRAAGERIRWVRSPRTPRHLPQHAALPNTDDHCRHLNQQAPGAPAALLTSRHACYQFQ